MSLVYDPKAPKKPTNLSINSDLLEKGRELGINLSATLEEALAEQVRAQQELIWKRTNAKAIKRYNDFVAEHGVFSDGLRKF